MEKKKTLCCRCHSLEVGPAVSLAVRQLLTVKLPALHFFFPIFSPDFNICLIFTLRVNREISRGAQFFPREPTFLREHTICFEKKMFLQVSTLILLKYLLSFLIRANSPGLETSDPALVDPSQTGRIKEPSQLIRARQPGSRRLISLLHYSFSPLLIFSSSSSFLSFFFYSKKSYLTQIPNSYLLFIFSFLNLTLLNLSSLSFALATAVANPDNAAANPLPLLLVGFKIFF